MSLSLLGGITCLEVSASQVEGLEAGTHPHMAQEHALRVRTQEEKNGNLQYQDPQNLAAV